MWLQIAIKPNITFLVNKLVCFAHNLGKAYWNALKHVMAYIKGTIDYGITYKGGGSLEPSGYVDLNYARYKDIR